MNGANIRHENAVVKSFRRKIVLKLKFDMGNKKSDA